MSILGLELLPEGIVMGADRNVSVYDAQPLTPNQEQIYIAQHERTKVIKWPNGKAIIGYVGVAKIGELYTDEWLYEFIGRNFEFASFAEVSELLRAEVQQALAGRDPRPLIIHLAGFEVRQGIPVPVVWFIRNYDRVDAVKGYVGISKEFKASEEFWAHSDIVARKVSPSNVRDWLREVLRIQRPFWFHHGTDLTSFNVLDKFSYIAQGYLYQLGVQREPQTLKDRETSLKMRLLTVGAYYEAFSPPGRRVVGGGADCVSLPWPSETPKS